MADIRMIAANLAAKLKGFGLGRSEISDAEGFIAPPNKLVREFVMAASVVIVCSMVVLGTWVTRQITEGVINNTAFSTALFMERYIQPLIIELSNSDRLSPATVEALDRVVKQRLIAQHLVSIKIWRLDGTVAYSTYKPQIGVQYPVEDALLEATKGKVSTEYGDMDSLENEVERALKVKLIEVYAPMYEPLSQRLFAVSEFYVDANALEKDLHSRYIHSWLVVGGMALFMILLTSGVVVRGNETIKRQQLYLEGQVARLSALLAENEELDRKLERATRATSEIVDRYMQKISAELHDGPAQHLALASLRLSSLESYSNQPAKAGTVDGMNLASIQKELKDAISEIRMIAAGLAMPELANLSLNEALELVAAMHAHRTGTKVSLDLGELPASTSMGLKSNLYRFVQEGLNNAFKHAGGVGQSLSARMAGGSVVIEVADTGPGFTWNLKHLESGQLGLLGLKNRIAIIGGEFEIKTSPGAGTRVVATVPLIAADQDHRMTAGA
jgi:signal transduction histidine kinase